jgi:hypothetical protein
LPWNIEHWIQVKAMMPVCSKGKGLKIIFPNPLSLFFAFADHPNPCLRQACQRQAGKPASLPSLNSLFLPVFLASL